MPWARLWENFCQSAWTGTNWATRFQSARLQRKDFGGLNIKNSFRKRYIVWSLISRKKKLENEKSTLIIRTVSLHFLSYSGQITFSPDTKTKSESTEPDDHEFFNLLEQVLQFLFCYCFFCQQSDLKQDLWKLRSHCFRIGC